MFDRARSDAAAQAFEAVGLVRGLIEGEEGLRELAEGGRDPSAEGQSEANDNERAGV